MFLLLFPLVDLLFLILFSFFFFNDTATTEIYTLSLHDALPISPVTSRTSGRTTTPTAFRCSTRSEEHTSELQSRGHLVCRLLLEKKKEDRRDYKPKKKKARNNKKTETNTEQ